MLAAYIQLARAYRHVNKPDQARVAINQAELVLKRLENADQLAATTIHRQEEWSDVLRWLNAL